MSHMSQQKFNRVFIIISLIILISFVVTSGCYWSKIVKTAICLDSISRQIASLEESQKFVAPGHEWNDEATSKYHELIAKRLEIYHSEYKVPYQTPLYFLLQLTTTSICFSSSVLVAFTPSLFIPFLIFNPFGEK